MATLHVRSRGESLRRIADHASLVAGWALILLAVLVGIEVCLRKLAGVSIQGVDEIGGYVLAFMTAIGATSALVHRTHIRVDMVVRLVRPQVRQAMHIIAYLTMAAVSIVLATGAVSVCLASWKLKAVAPTPLATPLFIPQGLWAAALTVFALVACWLALTIVKKAFTGSPAEVEKEFGIGDAAGEAREEQVNFIARIKGAKE